MNSLSTLTLLTAVARKETRTLLRSRRAFWLLMLTLAVAAVAFLVGMDGSENVRDLAAGARFSRQMFLILGLTQLCMMGLVTPLITAASFSGEREHKTLDLLYCTAVPRGALLFGKWLAAIVYQLLLVLCLLPILSLTFQLGGVGQDEYFFSAALIALTVATYAMVGLAVSVRARRSLASMTVTLGIILFLNAGIVLGLMIMENFFYSRLLSSRDIEWIVQIVSPVFTLFVPLMHGLTYSGNRISAFQLFTQKPVILHMLFQLTLFIISARYAWWCLKRGETLKPLLARKLIDDPELLARRRKRFPYYLADPLRRAQDIGDRQDPLLVKERRIGGAARLRAIIRLGYLGLALSVLISGFVFSNLAPFGVMNALAQFTLAFLALFIPVLAATVVSREREEGTLDLLLATTCPPGRIIRAKHRAILRALLILAASMLFIPTCLQFIFGRALQESALALLSVLLLVPAFLSLYSAAAVCVSAFCRRNATAIAICMVVVIVMFCSPMLFYVLVKPRYGSNLPYAPLPDDSWAWPLAYILPFLSPILSFQRATFHGNPVRLADFHVTRHIYGDDPFTYDSHGLTLLIRPLIVAALALLLLRLAAWRLARRKDTL